MLVGRAINQNNETFYISHRSLDLQTVVIILLFLFIRNLYLTSHVTLYYYFIDDEAASQFNQTIDQIEEIKIYALEVIECFMYFFFSYFFTMVVVVYQAELIHQQWSTNNSEQANKWLMVLKSFLVIIR